MLANRTECREGFWQTDPKGSGDSFSGEPMPRLATEEGGSSMSTWGTKVLLVSPPRGRPPVTAMSCCRLTDAKTSDASRHYGRRDAVAGPVRPKGSTESFQQTDPKGNGASTCGGEPMPAKEGFWQTDPKATGRQTSFSYRRGRLFMMQGR